MNYENTWRNQPDYISSHTACKSGTSIQTDALQMQQLRYMYIT